MQGKISGSIAHEIRNPLGVIGSSAYYLKMNFKDADDNAIKAVKQENVISYKTKPLDMDYFLAFIKQVIERKRVDEKLRESEERYCKLVETAQDAIIRDITERKRAERRLNAQHEVTKVLVESATIKEASPKIIQAVCMALEWDLGEIWEIDQQKKVLFNTEIWHVPSLKIPEFKIATEQITFPVKIGLPGIITGWGEELWPIEEEDLKFDFILKKPFDFSKLTGYINDLGI